jgi:hypothetical protein
MYQVVSEYAKSNLASTENTSKEYKHLRRIRQEYYWQPSQFINIVGKDNVRRVADYRRVSRVAVAFSWLGRGGYIGLKMRYRGNFKQYRVLRDDISSPN